MITRSYQITITVEAATVSAADTVAQEFMEAVDERAIETSYASLSYGIEYLPYEDEGEVTCDTSR